MAYTVVDKRSTNKVPSSMKNTHEYIAIHFLGVDGGQSYDLYGGGYGGHTTIYLDGTIYMRCFDEATIWAVGASSGWSQKHPLARNYNTHSVELCCYNENHNSSIYDKTWYFTQATQEAAVQYVRMKFKEYGWELTEESIDKHLLRHYDITTKPCPNPYVLSEGYKGSKGTNWTWAQFKEAVRTGTCPMAAQQKESETVTNWYRIRKAWDQPATQVAAYISLSGAKSNCPEGYTVYDANGNAVYSRAKFEEYRIRVVIDDLAIREGPGTKYAKRGVTGKGTFTIVAEEYNGTTCWGKLKSGAGWIVVNNKKYASKL